MTRQNQNPLVFVVGGSTADRPAIQSACADNDWELDTRRAPRLATNSGRVITVVPRLAAADLYVALHRRPVAVLSPTASFVRKSPAAPLHDRRLIRLADFVRYKALFVARFDEGDWRAEFLTWMSTVACDDHRDPRCLPLHMFQPRGSWDLDDPGDRKKFEERHRHQTSSRRSRRDSSDRLWSPATQEARHGTRDPITVAGQKLAPGVHWDVADRRRGKFHFDSADTEWDVKEYINAYPDGAVRIGKRCYSRWTRKDSAIADAEDLKRSRKR